MPSRFAPIAPVLLLTSSLACSSSSSSGDAGAAAGTGGAGGAAGAATAGAGGSTGGSGPAAGSAGAGGGSAGAAGMAAGGSAAGGSATVTMCPVGDPPAMLPKITGAFVQVDEMATNGPPKMTGGDIAGTWVFDSLTQYIPFSAMGLVDATMSTSSGTAWAMFGADGSFKLSTDFEVSVATVIGAMMQHSVNQSVGTVMTMGSTIMPMATCTTSVSTNGLEYTRTGGTGQMLIHTTAQGQAVDLLLGGTVK